MAVMPNFAVMLMFLLSGGGNDLLDYAQTDAYWKAKGVTVSFEQLAKELIPPTGDDVTKLIRQLGAEDPKAREEATQKIMQAGPAVLPQLEKAAAGTNREIANRASNLIEGMTAARKAAEVRRLMAIRTLGEMKKPEAVANLKPLLESKDPFVAEYAANAIASIEGKPSHRERIAEKARSVDLNLLPGKVEGVAQLVVGNGLATTLEEMLGKLNLIPLAQRKAMLEQLTPSIVEMADKLGNVRLDQATGGIFANAPNAPGWAVDILRGKWDATALSAATEQAAAFGATPETIEGLRVFKVGKSAAVVVVSDELAVLIVGDEQGPLPVEAMIAAVKKGSNDFATNADLAKLLTEVDQTSTFWLAMKSTAGLQQQGPPFLKAFDTVWMTVKRADERFDIHWQGMGKDPEAVKAVAAEIMRNTEEAAKSMTQMVAAMPAMQPALDFLKSVKCTTDGGKLEGGATLSHAAQMFPMLMLGTGASVDVAPNPPAPVPVEPRPAK